MTFQRDLAWKTLDLMYRSSVTYQFARYALGLKYEMVPPDAVHQIKRSVLDTLRYARRRQKNWEGHRRRLRSAPERAPAC